MFYNEDVVMSSPVSQCVYYSCTISQDVNNTGPKALPVSVF